MSILITRDTPSSSPEIRKLQDENKELKLRTYQQKLEQENRKLLKEIINNNNKEENETNNEHDAECEVTGNEQEAEKKEIYKYMLGAILAYALLMLFMFSSLYIIYELRSHGCGGPTADGYFEEDLHTINETDISEFTEDVYEKCTFYLTAHFNQNSAIVSLHNLTFGLVSAVVVSKIGSHQQQLQSHQNNLMTNQLYGSHIGFRLVYNFVTWTPRIYVLTWIFIGCTCLLCGSM